MLSKLRRLLNPGLRGAPSASAARHVASGHTRERPRILFAFHGGNRTREGAGRQFYREQEAFRRAILRCDAVVERRMGFSLKDTFEGRVVPEAGDLVEDERRNIVTLSALELGLCDLWRAHGVEPDAAVGVSGGEVAAAYAVGAFELEEAAEVICSVALLGTQSPLKGYFVWLDLAHEEAQRLAGRSPARLDVFMELSPRSSLAYCTEADYGEAQRFISAVGVGYRAAETAWAHHTPWAERALAETAGRLYEPWPRPLARTLYSPATGGVFPAGTLLDADYWYRAAVCPILFGRATCAALADGHGVVLNVCNHPTLKAGITQSADTLGARPLILDTMRRDESELSTWGESLRALRSAALVRPGGESPVAAADGLNLLSPEVVRDPYTHYAALRRGGSVHYLKRHGSWLVLNYEDVSHALKQPGLFPSSRPSAQFDRVLVEADPPDHTRVRRILSPYFSPQAFQALEGHAMTRAGELLAGAGAAADFDLVEDFAVPLTESVLARFLGLTDGEARALGLRLRAHRYDIEKSSGAVDVWAREYLARPKGSEGDGLCGRLLRGAGEGGLSPGEIASVIKLLWLAGTDTTSILITSSALRLLRHPAVRAEVQEDAGLLPAFVEEVLRLESPQQLVARFTRGEVELAGVTIPADAHVRLCLGAANRDPAAFEEPDRLSLRRGANNHLAFAAGPHFCMGAMLARMEARAALEALLAAWPGFRAARPLSELSYVGSIYIRALRRLPVRAA